MNNLPPIRESITRGWTPSWANWFQQVFECLRWNRSFNVSVSLNFPSVPAAGQTVLVTPISGVRAGDAVLVTPTSDVAGISFSATVSAAGQVSVFAKNFTAAPIDPPAQNFRILVLQN